LYENTGKALASTSTHSGTVIAALLKPALLIYMIGIMNGESTLAAGAMEAGLLLSTVSS
jgi:hypothetical protein